MPGSSRCMMMIWLVIPWLYSQGEPPQQPWLRPFAEAVVFLQMPGGFGAGTTAL